MFLQRLSRTEQKVYCQLAYAVMIADGELAEKESAFYDHAMGELSLHELPEFPAGGDVDVPDGAFDLSVSRKALLVELALLAAADGEVTGEERAVLNAVAEQMELDQAAVSRCVAYAERMRDILDEGIVLLAEGN